MYTSYASIKFLVLPISKLGKYESLFNIGKSSKRTRLTNLTNEINMHHLSCTHVGESARPLRTRTEKHSMRPEPPVATHSTQFQHLIDSEGVKILGVA